MAKPIAHVRHFESVDHVLAWMERSVPPALFPPNPNVAYHWLADGTLVPSIMSSFTSPYLYRGQIKRFRPCVPGVFRGFPLVRRPSQLSDACWLRSIADRVRLEEFLFALRRHPACDYAREIGLRIFPYSIAQHYEMATDRIDLTQNHRIAAFFATNAREDSDWRPVQRGVGVMYRIGVRQFSQPMSEHLECVGKQALPRPGEQKAWTLRLGLGQDFESLPVEICTFNQDEACGERINKEFGCGDILFPQDVLAEIADSIKSSPSLCSRLLVKVLTLPEFSEEWGARKKSVSQFEDVLGLPVLDRALIEIGRVQFKTAEKAVASMRGNFLNDVGLLAVRRTDANC